MGSRNPHALDPLPRPKIICSDVTLGCLRQRANRFFSQTDTCASVEGPEFLTAKNSSGVAFVYPAPYHSSCSTPHPRPTLTESIPRLIPDLKCCSRRQSCCEFGFHRLLDAEYPNRDDMIASSSSLTPEPNTQNQTPSITQPGPKLKFIFQVNPCGQPPTPKLTTTTTQIKPCKSFVAHITSEN